MFKLREDRLRQLMTEEHWPLRLDPFAPLDVGADRLHDFIDDAIDAGAIVAADGTARIAVYPVAEANPEPVLCVYPGKRGGAALLDTHSLDLAEAAKLDDVEGSVATAKLIVEAANVLLAEEPVSRDGAVLDQIARTMSGAEWDAETMSTVARILVSSGRTIQEPPED